MKSFIVFALFISHVYSLSYNWPTNPSHVALIKPHITALFGPQSYDAIMSIAKVADPLTFCEIPTGFQAMNRILLVERGNCTFYQKARNAMTSGAAGIIIADTANVDPDFPLRMGYPPTENPSIITIPVVSTSGADLIAMEKLVLSSNGSLIITLEQAGFDGNPTHGDSGNPTHGGGGNPAHTSTGHHRPDPTPNPNPTPTDGDSESEDDHPSRSPHNGRSRSIIMNGMIISAIVVSSCLCGFCMGRRCGVRGRYCRRQQQQVPSEGVAPLPFDSTVHGGERYVQVDMNQAPPVAYYGEQEMVPTPSAPPHDSSAYPSSAPSNYA